MSDKELQNEKINESVETVQAAGLKTTGNLEEKTESTKDVEKDVETEVIAEDTVDSEEPVEKNSEEIKSVETTEKPSVEEVKKEDPSEERKAEKSSKLPTDKTGAEEDPSVAKENDEDEEVTSSDDDEHHEETEAEEEKDYHALSKEQLITEFQKLLKDNSIQKIKNDVEEIKTEFNAKFEDELESSKGEFLAEGGNIIDFYYTTPLKKRFNSLYFDYKEKRNDYYKNLKRDLQANFKKREELIDELKGLLNAEENINTTYKHFKDIQERWHTAGAIPRDKYNTIWNTYRHHVENFYDFLHLNREFRDLDFKHNLDQKLKLIGRAEELAQQGDVGKAFRELQMLHKMWKEDIGPVAKEFREEVWEKFSAATKIIHDKRQEFLKDEEKYYEGNLDLKNTIIDKIKEIPSNTGNNHKAWQNAIKEVQKLRDQYFEAGKVPRTKTKEIWKSFKESTHDFNKAKNRFYKDQKKEQFINLEKKRELIEIAEENKDNEDFEVVTPLMKKIQSDWKAIGHVPRKESDKVWKQFKNACNHYFDRVHVERNEANKEEMVHFEKKKEFMDSLSNLKFSGKHTEDLKVIKDKISEWKDIGRVPFNKRNIERKFNKVLDELFGKLKLDKHEVEMIRFENKLNSLVSQEDERKLQNEEFFISKRITDAHDEIRQLENNLGFFRHTEEDNPLVKEVQKNIAEQKEQLDVWKSKLVKIRSLRKQ
ncbi:MAG: DUF349 domain-containing protein [Bacteroidetes bacterium]|nr:MAG: DUF349 domain-containing protein [Bacteroidota bacterium]